jgi:serine/threonine protein kinase
MSHRVTSGQLIADKYRVERVLGSGGMGTVVAATHLALGQLVAIKVMRPEAGDRPDAAERFLREARAAGKLRSEHAVEVKDVGVLADGTPFIVMEFLAGRDLASELRERGPLPVAQAVDYLLQCCLALAEAHALGIVHRDLKPANLFLTRRPDGGALVKILDFGISKLIVEGDEGGTQTQVMMGSAHYASPEQIRSARAADARSDIWSLGVTLYELVSGGLPFPGESVLDVCVAIARDAARPLGVPGLDEVVARCLDKTPARRWRSVAELAAAMAPFGSDGAVEVAAAVRRTLRGSVRSIDLPLPPGPRSDPPSAGTLRSVARGLTRRRWLVALAAAVLVVVGVVWRLAGEGQGAPARVPAAPAPPPIVVEERRPVEPAAPAPAPAAVAPSPPPPRPVSRRAKPIVAAKPAPDAGVDPYDVRK